MFQNRVVGITVCNSIADCCCFRSCYSKTISSISSVAGIAGIAGIAHRAIAGSGGVVCVDRIV